MGIDPSTPTAHNVYVDDTVLADLEAPLPQGIVGSLEACFTAFGIRCDHVRPCPISLEKFKLTPISTKRVQLGLLIDTHALTIGLPPEKLNKLRKFVKAFHEDRASILVREGAAFLGFLQHIAQHIPWFRHTFVAIQRSFINAVHVAQVSTDNMKKFINAFKLLEELPTTEHRAYHEFIAKQKSNCIFKSAHHKIWITSDFRDDIRLITQLTTEHEYWVTPIAHIIPRVHDFTAYCDSCKYGAGGYSSDLGFIWHIEWPIDKHGIDELIQDTTHINVLE